MTSSKKRLYSLCLLLTLTIFTVAISISGTLEVNAQTTSVTVTGADGTTAIYTLTQLQDMPAVSGYGGFYQTNQHTVNNGLWTGVSLLYLCNQVGSIISTSNVTVTGQGTNNFTYDMINSGTNLNPQYVTYNNITGAVQNQNQPVTIILAYQVNGTNLPTSSQPAPRIVIIGPEGLLMDGSGGKSITQVTVTNPAPSPTPTPTSTPSPTPSSTQTPTPTTSPTPKPTNQPSPSPSPTASSTASSPPTPEVSNSPQPIGIAISAQAVAIIAVAIITVIVIAIVIIIMRKK